ncbi:hypothetical protein RN001_001340 [Aquatica leii]|uniref:SWIM-type domain-containing protein n=1 Tax=Aquatica leii TaxID=1421715 RepID=A0AAN7PFW7_9COLE|nr:hypothetical protein RN001_001340 [Aquatica leii]
MKNRVYKVEISLDKSEDISSAQCSCPKGIKCHHIAALLLFAHYNVSVTDKHSDYLTQKCAVSVSTIMDVVNKTVGQHKNENWHFARKHRLTASNFGPVLSACRRNRFPDSLYRSLIGVYNLDGVKAIQWGRTHESVALENFTKATNLNVLPTGLWLTPTGFLGGSPDGLVGEDCIVEVKCPYSHRNDDLQEKLKNTKSYIIYFNDDGELHINKQHHYYDQVQSLLYILNRVQCYLVIWTLKGSVIAIIKKDLSWASNVTILQSFYVNQYIPKLIENVYNVK